MPDQDFGLLPDTGREIDVADAIAIRSGKTVRTRITGVGFTVSLEATAMQNDATGDTLQSRNSESETFPGRLDSRGFVVMDLRRLD